jgi:hypothetical protein
LTYRVEFVGPQLVDQIWQHVSDGLQHACLKTGGDIDSHYLWTECRSGRATLMVIADDKIIGASVWRIDRWADGNVCRCLCLYGENMRGWLAQHVEKVKELAKLGHADRLVTEGRPGFERIFPQAKVLRKLYEVRL